MNRIAPYRIVVPAAGPTLQGIVAGSGMVAVAEDDEEYLVYYEGNVFDSPDMRTMSQRLMHAADRAVTRYPTSAMQGVAKSAVQVVGTYDGPQRRTIALSDASALEAWCGESAIAVMGRTIAAGRYPMNDPAILAIVAEMTHASADRPGHLCYRSLAGQTFTYALQRAEVEVSGIPEPTAGD